MTRGAILLNGTDIRRMPQHFLRERLAYVQQKAWLFSGTIADNLRYSDPDASRETMLHAVDVAQAGEFVGALPDGLDAFVAQGGTNFSGGQRQRLSIARALVKKPELYIFDDSFSALDFKTDAALRRALAKETQDAAVLIIAQRVSTIQHADIILYMEHGNIVEQGSHTELLAKKRRLRLAVLQPVRVTAPPAQLRSKKAQPVGCAFSVVCCGICVMGAYPAGRRIRLAAACTAQPQATPKTAPASTSVG